MLAALLTGLLAFAPADPVFPINAACVDADAGTVAVGREVPGGWAIDVSTAGGPWQRAIGPVKTDWTMCPRVAAADDGTAVVTSHSVYDTAAPRVAVRSPGGGFGPATTLPRRAMVTVDAARGGHVAVLYGTYGGTPPTLLLMRPGVPPVKTAAPPNSEGAFLELAPDGSVSFGHERFHAGRWTSGSIHSPFPLALAPNGRQLLVTFTDDGIRVQVDDGPSTLVGTDTGGLTGAVAADGSAVVVNHVKGTGLIVVDRGPDGAWSAPRLLPRGEDEGLPDYSLSGGSVPVEASVATGGQVVVAWPRRNRTNVAVAGQAGGAWGRTATLSSPSRDPEYPVVDGDRVLWVEPDVEHGSGPLRAARAGAPAPADTTTPRLSLKVPERVRATRRRGATVPFTVRCDEACDVLIDNGDAVNGYLARSLAAGERRTLRFREPAAYAGLRLPYDVVVSDRAGNTQRRTVTVRVR